MKALWGISAALLLTGAAFGRTVTITYTGTVTSASIPDVYPPIDLTGFGFTVTQTFDPSIAGSLNNTTATSARVYGGLLFPSSTPPMLSNSMEFDGIPAFSLPFNSASWTNTNNYAGFSGVDGVQSGFSYGTGNPLTDAYETFLVFGGPLRSSLNWYQRVDADTTSFLESFGVYHDFRNDISFKVTHVSIAPAAVPETATWAMMLGGFGAVGGIIRARPRSGRASSIPGNGSGFGAAKQRL